MGLGLVFSSARARARARAKARARVTCSMRSAHAKPRLASRKKKPLSLHIISLASYIHTPAAMASVAPVVRALQLRLSSLCSATSITSVTRGPRLRTCG